MLVEVDECVFDEQQLSGAHGYEDLDPVGREAFVNHIHLRGKTRQSRASDIIDAWVGEMRRDWPDKAFRIYRYVGRNEVTIRFHMMRPRIPNWCEEGSEIIEVQP